MKVISFECHNGVHGSPPCSGKVRWRGTTVLCGCHCHHPAGYSITDQAPQQAPQ